MFYTHSLFKYISDGLNDENISSEFKPKLMATIFVTLLIIGNVISSIGELPDVPNFLQVSWLVALIFSVYPLQEAQDAINLINKDPLGLSNSKYSWKTILVMIVGGIMWAIILLGTFLVLFGEQTI